MIFVAAALMGPPAFWVGLVLAIFKDDDQDQELDERQYRVEFCIPTHTRTRTPEWQ